MSMFVSRRIRFQPKFVRHIFANPALNSNPAFRNPAIVPFGIEFVDEDLSKYLVEKNVDIDELESKYYQQCQNDAEFNNSRLPRSYDSKLWGFIYGQRLVSAKCKLATLREDERFLSNYLNETVKELTMRMDRFYPHLDYKSQVKAALKSADAGEDAAYNACYNEALSEVISNDAEQFLGLFKNNAFIPDTEVSENDKFNDFLPSNVEEELSAKFAFQWDFNSELNSNFEAYFDRMKQMENILSPKIDSLSKNLRKNFADFLLDSFNENRFVDIEYVITLIENATNYFNGSGLEELNNDELVKNCLDLLDEMTTSPVLMSKLFYGGSSNAEQQLSNKSKAELQSMLEGVAKERLLLINKSLQIYEYLKYNSITRLALSCLVKEYGSYFSSFLNDKDGSENISKFESANSDTLDEIVSLLSVYYENADDLGNCFSSLLKGIANETGIASKDILNILDLTQFEAAPCMFVSIMQTNLELARSNGDLLSEIKYSTLSKYVENYSSQISGVSLINALMNPSKNGVSGASLKNMSHHFASDASGATELLMLQITDFMQSNALVDGNKLQSLKTDLSVALQSELDNLKNICNQFNSSRNKLEQSIQGLTLNFENINFEHAQSVYDPLSTYLAQFRYYSQR